MIISKNNKENASLLVRMPPVGTTGMACIEQLSQSRGNTMEVIFPGIMYKLLGRFVPGMLVRQAETAPVYRHHFLGAGIQGCLNAFFREKVYFRPIHAVLATFHESKIKWTQFLPNFLEMIAIPPISAEPDFFGWGGKCPAAPKTLGYGRQAPA